MSKIRPYQFIIILLSLSACSHKPVSPYVVSKTFTNGIIPVLSVQIQSRLTDEQLLVVSSKIKKDNASYVAFKINFLLPGTIDKYPDVSDVYATVEYPETMSTKNFNNKDGDGNIANLEVFGISAKKAKYMLHLNPPDSVGAIIVGKFVDDNTKTVSIVYSDSKDQDQTKILEMDTTGKVVSAVIPTIVTQNGIKKMVVSQSGDYCIVKDSLLTMYSSEDLVHPFRSLKEGI